MVSAVGSLVFLFLTLKVTHVRCRDVKPALCAIGEHVEAYFAGEVELGAGIEPCNPTMAECWFPAEISEGPDSNGVYLVDWDDAHEHFRLVHATQTKRTLDGEACGQSSALQKHADDDALLSTPDIPCTIVLRLHWEASEPTWNRQAVANLKEEFLPDEIIDDFEWHVIFRYLDVDHCEQTHNTLWNLLKDCADKERCYAHPYVKGIHYIGDSPETRRKRIQNDVRADEL